MQRDYFQNSIKSANLYPDENETISLDIKLRSQNIIIINFKVNISALK